MSAVLRRNRDEHFLSMPYVLGQSSETIIATVLPAEGLACGGPLLYLSQSGVFGDPCDRELDQKASTYHDC